jgi:hypothetical protein
MSLARFAASLIWLALLTGCADPPPRDGLYSNVVYSEETGDQSGAILRFTDGREPRVAFALCEGACSEPREAPARVEGDVVTFTAMDEGDVGPVRFRGVFERGGVTLTSPDLPRLKQFLSREDELRR